MKEYCEAMHVAVMSRYQIRSMVTSELFHRNHDYFYPFVTLSHHQPLVFGSYMHIFT